MNCQEMNERQYRIMSEKKKALAVLWSPKSLLDFLWYYEAYGKTQYEYDVLVLTAGADENGKWKTRIYDYAVNAKIFNNISVYKESYVDQSLIKKLKVVTKMVWYAIRGKQKEYCVTELMPWIDYRKYSQIVTVFLPTIFSGELVALSETLEVVLLEDGVKDYVKHRKWPTIKSVKEMGLQTEMAGLFLSKMGYADPTTSYDFKPTRNCIKFSSEPKKLSYTKYKSIHKLNDMSVVNEQNYKKLVAKTFKLDVKLSSADVILFTAPLYNFSEKLEKKLVTETVKFIEQSYNPKRIILKKHPRDRCNYNFGSGIEVFEINPDIPAELITDLVNVDMSIFMNLTALLMSYRSYEKCTVIKYNELMRTSDYYRKCFDDEMKRMEIPKEIINLI